MANDQTEKFDKILWKKKKIFIEIYIGIDWDLSIGRDYDR